MPRYRIGVDVGGTFTDAVVLDEESGMTLVVKVPTTPDDPSVGFMTALARAIERFQINPNEVGFLAHATTIATNSIIAGGCGVAGLIATEGFRDVLEIARQARPALYDVFYDKPASLIPRHLCIGVPERMDANGSELVHWTKRLCAKQARRWRRRVWNRSSSAFYIPTATLAMNAAPGSCWLRYARTFPSAFHPISVPNIENIGAPAQPR